ncbi:MAG TPA: MFS transporter [Bryobacteraceae bacterium]|nr:MFS transporter [Bryobacteraceae bacterium]
MTPPMTPTRVRYRVVAFAVALAAITYFDRVCISTLAPKIMTDLHLTRVQMSFVFSAFTLAYAAFEIPTAWWGQRRGTRAVLTRIVAWWSAFTLATSMAGSYRWLLAVRFLFGAGEAGAWPNATRTFARWIPLSERGKVQGIFFAGAHLAGGLTPALVAAMLAWFTWRQVFLVFGGLGFGWAAAWFYWFRDEPEHHAAVNEAERDLILAGRDVAVAHSFTGWGVMRHPSVWALCAAYFSNGYGFYFLITWLPAYLEQHRGLRAGALSLFAGLPLLLSVLADLTGGIATDWLVRRSGLRIGRAAIGVSAYAIAAATMLGAAWTADPALASVLIALAAAASMFTLGASWAACIDIGGPASGVVSAAMNTTGQIGGVLSPIVLALLVDRFSNWSLPLYVMAALYGISSLSWLLVNPERK